MEIEFETWTSSENQSEIHYFIKGTNIYIGGFNPQYISKYTFEKFIEGFAPITGERKRELND